MNQPPYPPAGGERTVLRPSPGGRRPQDPAPPAAPAPGFGAPPLAGFPPAAAGFGAAPPPLAAALAAEDLSFDGLNPLVTAATPLLTLAAQLRVTPSHPDPTGLRARTVEAVQRFESQARAQGLANETVLTARYILCSLLDEAALATPWGATSVWSGQGMLVTFHKEAWGGEKFFLALEHLLHSPGAHLHVLELFYLCLALGFRGRYQARQGGAEALEELRHQLYQILRQQRGEPERDLSPQWQGVVDRRSPLLRVVPLWVAGAVAGLLLVLTFMGLSYALNRASDPVFSHLFDLGNQVAGGFDRTAPAVPPPVQGQPPAPPPMRLRGFLLEEIRLGLVAVDERPDRSTVTIRGDGLFPSGSATVKPNYLPILGRIAEALTEVPGQVLVTGHSDNVPIRSMRFPSNWHLSQERARSVADWLADRTAAPTRFRAEGRADSEPLAPNDSRENRARNRRVEITLFVPRGGR
jgi:type VI secretion system protein ImpK